MKEHPILFKAPMVRAILESRKTQTRRVVKMLPSAWCEKVKGNDWHPNEIGEWRYQEGMWYGLSGWNTMAEARCPYGQPGNRLWVRETWRVMGNGPDDTLDMFDIDDIQYRADDDQSYIEKYRPSIHMPRWASRILLEVTAVRVERLQDISEADATAEGWEKRPLVSEDPQVHADAARDWYSDLWEQLNGPGSWAANPWVWVVEFRRIET